MTAVVGTNPAPELKLVSRVVSYPIVSSIWDSAKGYYSTAKEKSPLVKYATDTLESNLEKGVKWAAPKVEPVLQHDLVKKIDEIGCRQLDSIENVTEKVIDSYQTSKTMIEQKVTTISNDVKATTFALVETSKHTLEEKVVPPVDHFLKESLIGVPINLMIDVTEKVVDKVLPEETQTEKDEQLQFHIQGPISRGTKLSRRIQREAFRKMKSISFRTPEQISSMKFSVDLIQYAATQIDNGSKAANQFVGESVHKAQEKTAQVLKTVEQNVTEARQKIHQTTVAATQALHTALETLSHNVPASVSSVSKQSLAALRKQTQALSHAVHLDSINVAQFSGAAQQSIAKLQEASQLLTNYVANTAEANLPPQVYAKVTQTIHSVLDILTGVVAPKKLENKLVEEDE